MTHGDHDRHSVKEISIDALHSHCNLIYKASSFEVTNPQTTKCFYNDSPPC